MEYAEGETLSEVLQRKGTLTESELKQLLLPILDGLEAVHEADFLHRDIKPGNIVIRDDGSPVLIDSGSARQALAEDSKSRKRSTKSVHRPATQSAKSSATARIGMSWSSIALVTVIVALLGASALRSSHRAYGFYTYRSTIFSSGFRLAQDE